MLHVGDGTLESASGRSGSFLPTGAVGRDFGRPSGCLDWTDGRTDTSATECIWFVSKEFCRFAGNSYFRRGMVLQSTCQ